MAYAPTRPPIYRGRRRPEGLAHVPRPMRERLALAADRLDQAGFPDSAADVRAVTAPGGWTLLRTAAGEKSGSTMKNMPLTMDRSVRDQLKAKADEFGVTLGSLVQDGFAKVLAGEWLPPRLAPVKSGQRVVLNVRVDDALRRQVDAVVDGLIEQAGHRVSVSSIAIAWMAEELGVDVAAPEPEADEKPAASKTRRK